MSKQGKTAEASAPQQFSMAVRLGDLVDSVDDLRELVKTKPNGKAPTAAVSMTLATVVTAIQPALDNYQKVLSGLREKYREAVKDGDGKDVEGKFFIPTKNQETFNKELDDLHDSTVTVPIGMILHSSLDIDGLGLTGDAAFTLRWLVRNDAPTLFVAPDLQDA